MGLHRVMLRLREHMHLELYLLTYSGSIYIWRRWHYFSCCELCVSCFIILGQLNLHQAFHHPDRATKQGNFLTYNGIYVLAMYFALWLLVHVFISIVSNRGLTMLKLLTKSASKSYAYFRICLCNITAFVFSFYSKFQYIFEHLQLTKCKKAKHFKSYDYGSCIISGQ